MTPWITDPRIGEQGEAVLRTPRLIVRTFQRSDLAPFAAMNADPGTMRFLGGPLEARRSIEWAHELQRRFAEGRLGMMPMMRRADGAFLGAAGLNRLGWYPDDVEVGWRLLPEHRGQGFATEAGRAWLALAFRTLPLARVISVADAPNEASRAVMERLGMRLDHVATLRDGDTTFEAAVHAVSREAWAAGA